MFSLFEWYILASYGYPLVSIMISQRKKAQYESEIETLDSNKTTGIVLKSREMRWNAPVMMGNQNIHVPVGGGLSTEWKEVGSAVQMQTDSGKQIFQFVNPTNSSDFFEQTTFANQLEDVKPVLEHYGLYRHIPVTLPMQIDNYAIPGKQVYLHLNTGLVDNNKQRLLSTVVWKKRIPGTLAIPVLATVCLGISWSMYSGYGQPPTDIYGKLISNPWKKV